MSDMCGTQKEPHLLFRVSHDLMPQNGRSALMLAAEMGHTEIAALLIERGADIQAKDKVRSDSLLKLLCSLLCFVFVVVQFQLTDSIGCLLLRFFLF